MYNVIFICSCLNAVMLDTQFEAAVQSLKQLQEKFSPQDMLTVIQRCMEQLSEAYEHAMASEYFIFTAIDLVTKSLTFEYCSKSRTAQCR